MLKNIETLIHKIGDQYLIYPLLGILIFCVVFTIRFKFIQVKSIKKLWHMLVRGTQPSIIDDELTDSATEVLAGVLVGESFISPQSAVLMGMSTTIGLGTIAGPIIALGFGGPKAVLGMLIASFFGAAVAFIEVLTCIENRAVYKSGEVVAGPMAYLEKHFNKYYAQTYSFFLFLLLTFWTANQSNSLAILFETTGAPKLLSGIFFAVLTVAVLLGGVQRVAKINGRIVPLMFVCYSICLLLILGQNYQTIPGALKSIFYFGNQDELFSCLLGFSIFGSLRWGISRSIQANEIGIGTSTFAHSFSNTKNPLEQAMLGVIPIFTSMILTLLTAVAILAAHPWSRGSVNFDISMFVNIMKNNFGIIGLSLLLFSGFLFGIGTILGNCQNAKECFRYMFKNKHLWIFYIVSFLFIVLGSFLDIKTIWTLVDLLAIPVAIPHMIAIFVISFNSKIFSRNK